MARGICAASPRALVLFCLVLLQQWSSACAVRRPADDEMLSQVVQADVDYLARALSQRRQTERTAATTAAPENHPRNVDSGLQRHLRPIEIAVLRSMHVRCIRPGGALAMKPEEAERCEMVEACIEAAAERDGSSRGMPSECRVLHLLGRRPKGK
mmetsp:Transcript_91145/g.254634  ORF Transcript_91145/g.254634 Transcript_91145/m.254634 type:complete len:155 (-) Transcript_91145:62-526(-)